MSMFIYIPAVTILLVYTINVIRTCRLKSKPKDLDKSNTRNDAFVIQKSILSEAKILFKLAIQIGLSMIFECCVMAVQTIFLGHLDNSSHILSAVGIATSFASGTVIVLSWGLHSALWTLVPQSIGSNQIHLLALYAQRAFICCTIFAIPLSILLFYTKNVLLFIGINSDGAIDWNIIQNYSYAMLPTSFLLSYLSILHRIMQNLNYSFEILVIQSICFFISVGAGYLFINTFGYYGCICAYNLNLIISIILSVLLLRKKGYGFIFKPLSFNKICDKTGMIQYLKLAVPGCLQRSLMWNIREFIMILTGCISDNSAVAATSAVIMIQIMYTIKFMQCGIANATTIRIGQYLGANNIFYAKRTIKIQILYSILLFNTTYLIYYIFRNEIASFFTNDSEVRELLSNKLMYVILLYSFSCSIFQHVDCVFRALGYQKISSLVICFVQYLMTFPLQLYLLFSSKYEYYNDMNMALNVIWIGSTVGYFLTTIILLLILIYCVDWNKALNDSNARIKLNNKYCQQPILNNALLSDIETKK